jgi:3,4-dihydroxy-2-butanone 4-phosphate synthase
MSLITIEEAIIEIKAGRMVILVDDKDRENEGDLTMAAEAVTPEAINFMAKYGRGLICLSMTGEKIDSLNLPLMVEHNTSAFQTGFYGFHRSPVWRNNRHFRSGPCHNNSYGCGGRCPTHRSC